MAGNGQVTCILAGLLPLDLPLTVALAKVEGQEMLESGFKVGVVGGEFRATPHHRRRGALDHRVVSLPDLTLTIREERRNQNQMRGREQQRRLDRR